MGYALVTGNLGNGRYSISVDYGADVRALILASANAAIARLQLRITDQEAIVAQADAAEATLRASVQDVFDTVTAELKADPTRMPPSQKLFENLLLTLRKQQAQHEPLRIALRTLEASLVQAQKRVANWNDLVVTSDRNAWCVDYTTEPLAGSDYVRTLEIKGEQDLIVLAPGMEMPVLTNDGALRARDLQSPAGAFYNAAMLPGWQKWRPTFRWGTIDSLDRDAHTATISLADAPSSAQGLDVNQAATLQNVPVTYMSCNTAVFDVGDRVVVQFDGQSWDAPRVIGFLDNPRACSWPVFSFGVFTANYAPPLFGARRYEEIAPMLGGSAVVEVRVGRGAWVTMSIDGALSVPPSRYLYEANISYRENRQIRFWAESGPYRGTYPLPDEYVGVVWGAPSPMSAANGVLPRPAPLEIVEFRVTSGADVIFNGAQNEGHYSTEISYPMRVRGTGGVVLDPDFTGADFRSWQIIPASEYPLFLESGT